MRLVKLFILLFVVITSAHAERFVLQAQGNIAWKEYDALVEYMNKSGECFTLARYGQSPDDFPHLMQSVLKRFDDRKTRQYVPLFVYSCMISGDPLYGYYIPDHWARKLP